MRKKTKPKTDARTGPNLFAAQCACVQCGKVFDERSDDRLTEQLTGPRGHKMCPECAHKAALQQLPQGEVTP